MYIEHKEIIGFSIGGYDICPDCLAEIKDQTKPKKIEVENEIAEANNEKEDEVVDEDGLREEVVAALAAGGPLIILSEEDSEAERSLVCDLCGRVLTID